MIMQGKLHKLWKGVVVAHFRYYYTTCRTQTERSTAGIPSYVWYWWAPGLSTANCGIPSKWS